MTTIRRPHGHEALRSLRRIGGSGTTLIAAERVGRSAYGGLEVGQGHDIDVTCRAEPLILNLDTVTVLAVYPIGGFVSFALVVGGPCRQVEP